MRMCQTDQNQGHSTEPWTHALPETDITKDKKEWAPAED